MSLDLEENKLEKDIKNELCEIHIDDKKYIIERKKLINYPNTLFGIMASDNKKENIIKPDRNLDILPFVVCFYESFVNFDIQITEFNYELIKKLEYYIITVDDILLCIGKKIWELKNDKR